jgi:hypothetical protein
LFKERGFTRPAQGLIKLTKTHDRSQWAWGFWGALAYVVYWGLVEGIWKARHPGLILLSSLSYESKYPYIFARELVRHHSLVFFNNPFGTLETNAHLIYPYSSFLRFLFPIWRNHLWLFDRALGALLSFGLFWELRNWCPRAIPKIWQACFFIGGSLGTLTPVLFPESEWIKGLLLPLQPALLFSAQTNWLLFETLLLVCIRTVDEQRWIRAAWFSLLLGWLHPIFGTVSLACMGAVLAFRFKRLSRAVKRWTLLAMSINFLYLIPWNVFYLPKISSDAHYFFSLYRDPQLSSMFSINFLVFLFFVSAPLLLLLVLKPAKRAWTFSDYPGSGMALLILSVVTLTPTLHASLFPQSGRWALATVYWIGLSYFLRSPGVLKKAGRLSFLLAVLFILDGISMLQRQIDLTTFGTRESFALDREHADLLRVLKRSAPGHLAYFRACNPDDLNRAGDFEYLMMSETQMKAMPSHFYFTPNFDERGREFSSCPDAKPAEIFRVKDGLIDYIVHKKGTSPPLALVKDFENVPLPSGSSLVLLHRPKRGPF